ncbi:MAG: flagellar cap protein FliD N-terminal domain-containing protein, partial [Arcobacteraceae bacterium]
MATGILGLGTSGSAGLSQELIDKLKEAEKKAKVEPIETKLETWDKELEKFGEIEAKINELFASVKTLDLFNSTGTNAFEQIVANTSGTSAIFEAVDTSLLNEGMTTINVTQLAKRDVYQTEIFTSASDT